jgi:hypothetical protein
MRGFRDVAGRLLVPLNMAAVLWLWPSGTAWTLMSAPFLVVAFFLVTALALRVKLTTAQALGFGTLWAMTFLCGLADVDDYPEVCFQDCEPTSPDRDYTRRLDHQAGSRLIDLVGWSPRKMDDSAALAQFSGFCLVAAWITTMLLLLASRWRANDAKLAV